MQLNPAFFDILGIGAFAFVAVLALWLLATRRLPPIGVLWLLLLTGTVGLIVDSIIVFQTFLK